MRSLVKHIIRLILQPYSFNRECLSNDTYWEVRLSSIRRDHKRIRLNDWQKFRVKWARARLEPGSRVYDFGAGIGSTAAILGRLIKGEIVAFESSKECLLTLKSRLDNVVELDLETLSAIEFPYKFPDYILLFEVIEHLLDSERVLIESFRIAKRGLFFSVPNTGYFPYRLRLLFGRFPRQWISRPSEHLRFWTFSDLEDYVRCLEFEDVEIEGYMGVPYLNKVWPSLFAAGLICKLKKRS
jgi:2-polyprenyl-3-methyl-5-hydroxy-6-metoxy-1,4-benzoquinol methylase